MLLVKWLVNFNAQKTQLSLNFPNSSGAVGVKMVGFVHNEKLSSKISGFPFSSEWH